MRNFLCWDPRAVRQVVNPYAEHISDGLFRAVHSDWPLKVSPPVGKSFQDIGMASWADMSPGAFLDDFLREDRPHALAAILGDTGSGKSHLVHWMRLNIQPRPDQLVLTVKKSGTSLRSIVRMIIAELPPDQQSSFLETLQSTGDGLQSKSDQRQQLLNDLAQVIREDVLPSDAEELEQELVSYLPNLFQDPHMRQAHFLGENTVIAEIVDHIFAVSNAKDRPIQRREFVEDDLPLGGMDFAAASAPARAAMQVIGLDPPRTLPLAIKIMNRNLNRAIARTLSFSGDRVEELMIRLRSHLKSQNKELILLIEEFARLQGIDRVLLQTITSQGDERLCKMRTAIAVTTGFFQSVAETAYMRTSHIVDMDRSAGRLAGKTVTRTSLSQFAARYLNAVRLGRDEISIWSKSAAPSERPKSKCETCQHQTDCHAIFGEVDGYGLYPFTAQSLWNAASRVDKFMPERLNPRVLQNDLLVEVLDNFGPSIEAGAFPPFKLLEKIGGITALPAVAQAELENRNPQNFHRWAAFLELYDGSGIISNLDDRLRSAFEIPEIPGAGAAKALIPDAETAIEQPPRQSSLSKEDLLIAKWIAGEGLDQTVANNLRLLIYSAVSNAIDWDMLGLAKASFAGRTGKAFQTASISFDRQTTQVRGDVAVKLVIPGDLVSMPAAAAALQGVLRASKDDFRWEFADGEKMLAAFLDCVEIWAGHVEMQLRAICAPNPKWNQAAAALEMLCVGAALGGKIKPNATIADMIDGAFSKRWAEECPSTAPDMKAVYDKLMRNRATLVSIAESQMSSMKGGQSGAMLNPGRVVGPIQAFRKAKWQLTLQPPDADNYDVAKVYRDIKGAIATAVASETQVRRNWLEEMEGAFGQDATRASVLGGLEAAMSAIAEAGIGTSHTANRLRENLDRFRTVQFDESVKAARGVVREADGVSALPYFGRGHRNAVEAGTGLMIAAKAFLDAVEQNIGANRLSLDAKHEVLADSLQQIDVSLEEIEANLRILTSASAG